MQNMIRHSSGSQGLDRVFGGGMVRGAVVLFVGEPEVSELLGQVAGLAAAAGARVVYASGARSVGEEAVTRVVGQFPSYGIAPNHLIVTLEPAWDHTESAIAHRRPSLIVVDALEHFTTQLDGTRTDAEREAIMAKLVTLAHPAAGLGPVVLVRCLDTDPFELAYQADAKFVMRRHPDGSLLVTSHKNRHGMDGESVAFRREGDRLVEDGEPIVTPWAAEGM